MRTHKNFSWGHKRSLFFVGIQEFSARRVRNEQINRNYSGREATTLDFGSVLCLCVEPVCACALRATARSS